MQEQAVKNRAGQAFWLALLIAAAIFLPFVIFDGGYFIYYGDFNVQQIPFYKLAHEAVRSGDVFWSWHTDLGANFIGSYSFYLLFSPFFWLTLPFPTSWLPFFMAPLLMLKTACASLTAYLYLSRFFRDTRYAVIGALMYAFSGWMLFNIFFNHFHEAAVFFPLMLLGVEKLIVDDKKAFFALTVAACAIVNYWFFVGEAVFVVLYVFVRMTDKTFPMNGKKFLLLTFEAVLGLGLACVVLMPSAIALLGNPRTGLRELATGWNAWLYWHEQRQPAILSSLIFPPDLPARPNFFPDHGAKWSSLSAWLPMVSLTGVLAYFFSKTNDWIKKLLGLSLLFALVPWLNSLFILLNNSYYARWFFMPVLIMALASARALEETNVNHTSYKRAIRWVGIVAVGFLIMCGLTPAFDDDVLRIGLAHDLPLMWLYGGITVLGLLATALLILFTRRSRRFTTYFTAALAVYTIAFSIFFMASGKNNFERSQYVINTAIKGREQISLPQEPFARSDAHEAQDNLLMFWHLPNIQAFHSIVPTSIMEFYPEVGVTRDVGSRPEAEFFALRPLLSVRWLFIEESKDEQEPMPGYKLYAKQAGFNVYENENFLPMGFCYDEFITRSQLEDVSKKQRSNMMLKAIVLEDDGVSRNSDILKNLPVTGEENFTAAAMREDAAARRDRTASAFRFDTRGFSAETDFDSPQLVFFSVPWEKGWSATVNGQQAVIERANIGFMAVRVPAGRAEIRFDYFAPGLREGFVISLACLTLLLGYAIIIRQGKTPSRPRVVPLPTDTVTLTFDEFQSKYGDTDARRAQLEKTLADAAGRYMPETLGENERTLHFSAETANTQEGHQPGENMQQHHADT